MQTPVWSNRIDDVNYKSLLKALGIPEITDPPSNWLTEFEDRSSPRSGNADLYFSTSPKQDTLERDPFIQYTAAPSDCIMCYALTACMVAPVLIRRLRK